MCINYSYFPQNISFFLFFFSNFIQIWTTTDETVVSNSNNNNNNNLSNGTQFKQNKLLATTPYITGVNNNGSNNDTYEHMELQTPSTPFILTNEDAYGIEDFIHLPGPLTEDAVVRVLHTRFKESKHFVRRSLIYFLHSEFQFNLSLDKHWPDSPCLKSVHRCR